MVGGLNVHADVPPFLPAPARFPTVGHPFCLPLCCFSVAIWTFSSVLCLSRKSFVSSSTGCHFQPPSHRGSYPRSGLATHRSSMLVIGGLLVWFGGNCILRMCLLSRAGAWRASQPLCPLSATRGPD
jgi:hypothetical protein